ncbi:TetR/AcrR family transcriptional regulator [Shimia litoralis]|uniref:TetR/AcrR family transcriptional regulator n=1 Tax=Shimia litoralis TaxID=420403 RepID=A0A4U7N7G2_9RHOB|nr:TetR/AcrR family transcriptional regulator [Shimia litoralis]TKZ20524.1 TetR/AcrR family transcriptional regulator [Shimia litoralis]
MDVENSPKHTVAEAAWLDAAYKLLTTQGVEAVKVMPLARMLGVSRTSFYWHFKSREALLEEMIRRWEEQNTGNLVARTEAYAESICEAMFNLFDCWLDSGLFDARLDLAVRNWARNDDALQLRLDEADKCRSGAIADMFKRFGYSDVQAEVRSMSIIYTQIGYISMQVTEDWHERIGRMPDYIKVFTGKYPSDSEIRRFWARHDADAPNVGPAETAESAGPIA